MSDNKISPSSIKKVLKKLQQKRRVKLETLQLLSDIAFITTGFLAIKANDFSSRAGSQFLRNKDLRKVFEIFGIENVYDDTYDMFVRDFINQK